MKRFLIPALLLACGVGTAQAGTIITQTFSSPPTPVAWSTTYDANQFNPSLGTLTSVEIEVSSNIVASVDVYNFSGSPQSFTKATASIPITLTGPASLSLSATGGTAGLAGSAVPGLNTFPGLPTTASTSTTLTSSGALAPYIGTGVSTLVFDFNAGDGTYSGAAVSGVVFFGGSATANATVDVIYTYTAAIPEPSSVILAGIGIVGVAVFGRRRAA